MIPIISLKPLFIIEQIHDLYTVQMVGHDAITPGERCCQGPNTYQLTGAPAQLLYLGLARHRFGTPPQVANIVVAKQARAHLKWFDINPDWVDGRFRRQVEMYNLASRVVAHWGESIQPWLGWLMVDEHNQPMVNHPKYAERIYFNEPGKVFPF